MLIHDNGLLECYFMRIVCQQTILMKYALFVIFEKSIKIWNCRLLQVIGGALWVNCFPLVHHHFMLLTLKMVRVCNGICLVCLSGCLCICSLWPLFNTTNSFRMASLRCGPWARHICPSLVLVQPRKIRPCLTENLLMGRKESNQTKKCQRVD